MNRLIAVGIVGFLGAIFLSGAGLTYAVCGLSVRELVEEPVRNCLNASDPTLEVYTTMAILSALLWLPLIVIGAAVFLHRRKRNNI
ncbi:hypothetical protein [Fuscibacter oryzae]|uniref:Uncharacterized protein n=1 Tax=Fuscibacter oryzae TaxID=2803939 RepID=A0A8J7ST73_9RHOB|nr:hypothetical protein [Fuscibacter oryzae]MBL4928250.1 hypothetical protein [Fuscibacter oryzae]